MPTENENKFHLSRDYLLEPLRIGNVLLYQVGRLYCRPSAVISRHSQRDFFEFTVITAGEGTVVTNGVPVAVSAGDIYVSFSGDFHEIISSKDLPLKYDFLSANTLDGALLPELEYIVRTFRAPTVRIIRNDAISALVSRAIAEINAESELYELIASSIITEILCLAVREFRNAEQVKLSSSADDAEVLCYRIMNYIDSHIYTMRSLTELSEEFRYNYNYLSNLYKRVTGDTIAAYYRERRLETARLLLTERGAGVTYAATILGYSTVYTFSRAFKERYGISPREAKRLACVGLDSNDRLIAGRERSLAEQAVMESGDIFSYSED